MDSELLALVIPALACVQLAFAAGRARLTLFILSAFLWISTAAAVAVLLPSITYYSRGPLNAAGVYTQPFVGASVLAVAAIYLCSALDVPRKYYLAPISVIVTLTAHSQSWIA